MLCTIVVPGSVAVFPLVDGMMTGRNVGGAMYNVVSLGQPAEESPGVVQVSISCVGQLLY